MDFQQTQQDFGAPLDKILNPRPRILVTPDAIAASSNNEAEYRLRANYIQAVVEAGGVPFIAPHEPSGLSDMIECAHGILITGTLPGVQATYERQDFEERLIHLAIARNIPTLGICHGMQLIGKCLGGRLLEDVPRRAPNSIDHNPQSVPNQIAHPVALEPNTILNPISGAVDVDVNSSHGHMLLGPGSFRVLARSPDGVIEAISGETGGFCVGVQWHPEYQLGELDRRILKHFVSASASFAHSQNDRGKVS